MCMKCEMHGKSDQCCNDGNEPFLENGPCGNPDCPYHMAAYFRKEHQATNGNLCLNCIDDANKGIEECYHTYGHE